MVVAFCVPAVGPADAASSGYEALQVPEVDTDGIYSLGTVLCTVRAGALKVGDSVSLRLPTDFQFLKPDGAKDDVMKNDDWKVLSTADSAYKNYIEVPAKYAGDDNIIAPEDLEIDVLGDNEIKVTVKSITDPAVGGDAVYFLLHMDRIYVPSGASTGDIELIASGPSGTGFPTGTVAVGRVAEGQVNVSVIDAPTFSDNTSKKDDPVTIRIEEDLPGSLEKDSKSLKLVLPNGLEWQDFEDGDFKLIWGAWGSNAPTISTDKSDSTRDLVIYTEKDELIIKVNKESTEAACFELTLGIDVADENKVKKGDVVAKVRGNSDINVTELTVGVYGEYDVEIKVDGEPTDVVAGKLEQEIADIKVVEAVKESLIDGRTVTLKLPSNAKWGDVDDGDSDNGARLKFVGFVGDDGREIKYEVEGASTDAAELTLENMEIVLEPKVDGDIVVEVGGTQGLTGELVVAKAVVPIEIEASEVKDVKIGAKDQVVGDLTITELVEEAINDDEDLILKLPEGVKFETTPTVKVTDGDLDIDEDGVKRTDEDRQLVIPIDGQSTDPSTIKVTDILLTVDRTVAEGDIKVKVQGDAVIEVNNKSEIDDYFTMYNDTDYVEVGGKKAFKLRDDMIWPQSTTAAECVLARVVTPAPGEQTGVAVFKIGEKTYTVNGQEVEMDVAPIAEAGRTYLPVRYVANAMGIPDNNITWDQNSQTITVLKADRVVQMKVGSKQVLVNGVPMMMDVAPKVVPGRVLVPFRFLAQALGAEVVWDESDPNTIILNF